MMDNNMNRNVETIKSLPEDLLAEIQNLAKLHGLTDVLLFGSRARADYNRIPKQILKTAYEYGLIEGISLSVV